MSQFINFLEGIANTSPLTPLQKQLFKEKVITPFSNLDTTDIDTLPPTHLPANMAKTGNILILNDGNIAIKQSTSIKCITTADIATVPNENIVRVYDAEKMMEGLLDGFDLFGNPIIYHTDGVDEQLKRAIIGDKGILQNGVMVYTRQLSGVIVFQIDEGVPNTFDLAGYINTFLTNVKTVWEAIHDPKDATLFVKVCPDHTILSLSDFEDLLAAAANDAAREILINSKIWFLYDDRKLIDFSVAHPNTQQSATQMIQAYNTTRILLPGVTPIIECAKYTDRFVHILVGNGKNAEMATASYIDTTNSTGYMHIIKNGDEAAHEFGHLCGLADRYLECVKTRLDTVPINGQKQVYARFYGFGIALPYFDRFTIPLAFREPKQSINYNVGQNLMADKTKHNLTDYQFSFIFGQSSGNNYKNLWEPAPLRINIHGTEADLSGIDAVEILYTKDILFPENFIFKDIEICSADGERISNVPKKNSIKNHWFKVTAYTDGEFGITPLMYNSTTSSSKQFLGTESIIDSFQSYRIGWSNNMRKDYPLQLFTYLKSKKKVDHTFDSDMGKKYRFSCTKKTDIHNFSNFGSQNSLPRMIVTWAILEKQI